MTEEDRFVVFYVEPMMGWGDVPRSKTKEFDSLGETVEYLKQQEAIKNSNSRDRLISLFGLKYEVDEVIGVYKFVEKLNLKFDYDEIEEISSELDRKFIIRLNQEEKERRLSQYLKLKKEFGD